MNVECACAVWDVERILEVTVLLLHTNPLLTHNHNANTIEYKYKIQIQPALIPPTQRWRGPGMRTRCSSDMIACSPCHTQPIHHHVSSRWDGLWGVI